MKKILILFFCALAAAACHGVSDEPAFTLGITEISLPCEGGDFELDAKGDFDVSGMSDWISRKSTLLFTATRNDSFRERTGYISLSSGGKSYSINVRQAAISHHFKVSPASMDIAAEGGEFEIKVDCNIGFELTKDAGWIEHLSSSKEGDITSCRFNAGENTSLSPRSGILSFAAESGEIIEVTVRQTTKDGLPEWGVKEFYHRSLAMRFTATWCGYCPMMHSAIETAMSNNPDKIEYAALHAESSKLASPGVKALISRYGINGFPSGIMDGRAEVQNFNQISTTTAVFSGLLKEMEENYPCVTGTEISSTLKDGKIEAEIKLFSKVSEDLYITVLLLEDKIFSYQADNINGAQQKYEHNSVCRESLTDIKGELLTVDNSFEPAVLNYSMELPSNVNNSDNLRILVYVMRSNDAIKNHVKKVSNASYGKYNNCYVDNAKSAKINTNSALEYKE